VGLLPSIPEPVADFSPVTLEWEPLLTLISQYATAAVTREWLMALAPSTSGEWAAEQHALVAEMRISLAAGARPALASLFDPATLLAKARIAGTALDAGELLPLLALADDVVAWYSAMQEPPEELASRIPSLRAMTEPLRGNQLAPLLRSLRSRISPDGTLSDDASPDLRRIRREIERQQRAIESSLRQALRRFSGEGSTQEDLITIRGERFVIPVKAEWKRRIPGVVHGASSSGQSVYIEPLETIEQNNELIRLLDEEQAEIHRIFVQMTSEIGREAVSLNSGASILAEVDALAARARFADEYECTAPTFASGESPEFLVEKGRHPLLERRLRRSGGSIVPLTLGLESDARQLIISGPNTGGKTVALKTAGLLAMMAQAGIPVPAERLVMPVFRNFLADIGDAQSIEQNLSTFSAHIVNLNRIAAEANEHSLVLLDELGSATDPEEGAALAVAIAEHFLAARAWSIISTHHTSLKVYAAQVYEGKHAGVLNAAVGFDEKTLAPTYVLRLGVPGASAGINIAQRIGLDPAIVAAARRQLSSQTEDIAHFLDRLHADLAAVDRERAALRQRESEVERERQRLETEGLKEWKAKVRELEHQLAALMKDFEFRMREAVKAIDDRMQQQKLSKEAERRIARLRREFAEQFNATAVAQHTGADKGDPQAQPHVVRHVAAGDTVRLKSLGRFAVVERQIDDGNFEVAMGPLKMRVPRADIAEVVSSRRELTPVEAARRRGVSVTMASSGDEMRSEINVIGQTVAEATAEVESFLDRAFLAGLERVRIIHGTGMGVLRRALRTMLQNHPHVVTVTEATQAEGGAGATIVDLRQ
jgi:DNA mismatch repair protein MutS2